MSPRGFADLPTHIKPSARGSGHNVIIEGPTTSKEQILLGCDLDP
jgi:hypothetical protein